MNKIRIFPQNVPTSMVVLAVLEYAALVLSVYVAHFLRFAPALDIPISPSGVGMFDFAGVAVPANIYAGVNFVCLMAIGAYRLRSQEGLVGLVLRALVAVFLIGTFLLSVLIVISPNLQLSFGRGALSIAALLSLGSIAVLRAGYLWISRFESMKWRVMIIGAGHKANRLAGLVGGKDGRDLRVVGFYPVTPEDHQVDLKKVLPADGVYATAQRLKVEELVVAVDERRRSESGGYPLDELLDCKLDGIRVSEDISFLERETGRLDVRSLSPGWLVFTDGFRYSPVRDAIERTFDILVSSMLLLVTWPLMLLAAVAIKLEDGMRAPLIYSQERVGYGGKVFPVRKFRSMRVDAEKDGAQWAQKNDSRVTRVGAFMRKSRIDELPQILNVLVGDMSFVGPRPERPEFVEDLAKQIPYFKERHRMKPGITGWAQISYRYGASIQDAEEKLKYDLYYIKNHGLLFDLFILVRTVEIVLLGAGVR